MINYKYFVIIAMIAFAIIAHKFVKKDVIIHKNKSQKGDFYVIVTRQIIHLQSRPFFNQDNVFVISYDEINDKHLYIYEDGLDITKKACCSSKSSYYDKNVGFAYFYFYLCDTESQIGDNFCSEKLKTKDSTQLQILKKYINFGSPKKVYKDALEPQVEP